MSLAKHAGPPRRSPLILLLLLLRTLIPIVRLRRPSKVASSIWISCVNDGRGRRRKTPRASRVHLVLRWLGRGGLCLREVLGTLLLCDDCVLLLGRQGILLR